MIERHPGRARAAHLLRRTSLTVNPARIDELADLSWDDAVAEVLRTASGRADGGGAAGDDPPATDDWTHTVTWWVNRMIDPVGGLRERMAWFWHGLLTTSADKVSSVNLIRRQLADLRAGALGDYRTILHTYVTGGALVQYLDADGSMAANPNENLARELMELFTIGRDAYTEDDVRSAARALAGWVVEDGEVSWRRENAFVAPLLFKGVQDDWDTDKVVDFLCDQPETAVRVSTRLWRHLVGTDPDPAAATDLGAWWQERDLAVPDLVERILLDPATPSSRLNRPRSGLEWFTAYRAVVGGGAPVEDAWTLQGLGQMPYQPPNVGGWPDGPRWLSPGSLLARASLAFDTDWEAMAPGRSGTVDDILDRCGLHEISPATRAALDAVRSSDELPAEEAQHTRWRLALSSPEFSLA